MNWISIGLGAVSGLLAGLIARLIIRDWKARRAAFFALFAALLALLLGLGRVFLLPDLKAGYQVRSVESALLANPLYQAIQRHEPQVYKEILNDMSSAIARRESERQVLALGRRHISKVVQRRLPGASDDALVAYMRVLLTELEILRERDSDACYAFLFDPNQSTPRDISEYFSEDLRNADNSALADVIRSSAEWAATRSLDFNPFRMAPFYKDLSKEWGNDVQMLANPQAQNVDKEKVCGMTIGLYERILRLPKEKSAKLLRSQFDEVRREAAEREIPMQKALRRKEAAARGGATAPAGTPAGGP